MGNFSSVHSLGEKKQKKKATTTQHVIGVCLDVTEVLASLLLHDICFLQVS